MPCNLKITFPNLEFKNLLKKLTTMLGTQSRIHKGFPSLEADEMLCCQNNKLALDSVSAPSLNVCCFLSLDL